jgi:hypothetical protein
MMEPKEYISGKIFFRHMGNAERHNDPRELFACAGVLGVPDSVGLKNEHLYHLTSGKNPMGDLYGLVYPEMGLPKDIQQLHLHLVTGQDLTKEMRGQSIGGVITSSIWQI